uniref:SAM-dependent MTase RsmB/NOP-type domain-containing protein n=1 Tax=Glossina brevipalpis TaxID=37001 RepID=A0A1A9WY74_9MUSC
MSGFRHSIKVPSKYKKVAAILKTALESKKSLKSLVYEQKKHVKLRDIQAVLTHYTSNQEAIDAAIEKSKILEENPRLSRELCIALVTELIYHCKELKGDSKPVQTVRAYRKRLLEALGDDMPSAETLAKQKDSKPRYVRVNTNLINIEDAHAMLVTEEWRKKECPPFENYENFLKEVQKLQEDEYMVDMHLNDLFIFHGKQKHYWATHQYIEDKKFMLQDKATCLVAEILNPSVGCVLLDMCAAPGMKTIHLSNFMKNKGVIYAIEKNPERYRLLCSMIRKAGCKIVKPIEADALTVTAEDCPDVEYILVDPPCSGSGMQNRMSLKPEVENPDRLTKLGGLQIKLLNHAMSNFPYVKRIIYSTCSLYKEENEQVVKKCLYLNPNFKLLSAKKALRNKWHNLGDRSYDFGKKCLYSRPETDLSIGMFIAIFEKCRNNTENA